MTEKTRRIRFLRTGPSHGRYWHARTGDTFCVGGIRDYFNIPRDADTAWLCISDRRYKDDNKMVPLNKDSQGFWYALFYKSFRLTPWSTQIDGIINYHFPESRQLVMWVEYE